MNYNIETSNDTKISVQNAEMHIIDNTGRYRIPDELNISVEDHSGDKIITTNVTLEKKAALELAFRIIQIVQKISIQ